jgi:hypothetical protein
MREGKGEGEEEEEEVRDETHAVARRNEVDSISGECMEWKRTTQNRWRKQMDEKWSGSGGGGWYTC